MIPAPRARRTHATMDEAARMLHMSRSTLVRRMQRHNIKPVELRGRILIPRTELARLLWAEVPALRH